MSDDVLNPFVDDDEDEVLVRPLPPIAVEPPALLPRHAKDDAGAEDTIALPDSLTDELPLPDEFTGEVEPELPPVEEQAPAEVDLALPSEPQDDLDLTALLEQMDTAEDEELTLPPTEDELESFGLDEFGLEELAAPQSDAELTLADLDETDTPETPGPHHDLSDFGLEELPSPAPAPALEDDFDFSQFDFADPPAPPEESEEEGEDEPYFDSLPAQAMPLAYAEEDDEDEDLALEAEDWGFNELPAASETPAAEDWGFLDLPLEPEPAPEVQAWDEEPQRFPDEEPALETPAEPTDAPEDLSSYLADLEEESPPADSADENEAAAGAPVPKWKQKVQDTLAQIKSELRGGDEAPANRAPQNDEQEKRQGNGLLAKLFSPYTWLAGMVTSLLLKLLSPLKKIPALAGFIAPNKFFKALGYVLPLVIVALILHWQGSKPLPPAKDISFPDGGSAAVGKFGYDKDNGVAYATVTNTGAVIAEVTPTLYVYSIQPTINPVSFFFPKVNEACVGKPVRVDIGASKKISVPCEVKGSPRKVTGEIEW